MDVTEMQDTNATVPTPDWINNIRWNEDGLVPAIAQDAESGDILMMAWMNARSLQLTAEEGQAVYWSRSRGKLWRKGETSGHQQIVSEIRLDCDDDVILLKVEQKGGMACHTGRRSCFYRKLENGQWQSVDPVLKDPDEIYGHKHSQSDETSGGGQDE
jgi:phosphoribosyl-AMP cyclohydrolase